MFMMLFQLNCRQIRKDSLLIYFQFVENHTIHNNINNIWGDVILWVILHNVKISNNYPSLLRVPFKWINK